MAVFANIFNKIKRQPKSIEQQIIELGELSGTDLAAVAEGDNLVELRVAAVEKLDYCSALVNLAYSTSSANELQRKAKQRIAIHIDNNSVSAQQFTLDSSNHSEGKEILEQLSVIGFCKNPDLQKELLASQKDDALLYEVALRGASVSIRELAAKTIENPEQLKLLLKTTKGKDKLVYRIVKEKCDSHRQQLLAEEQQQKKIAALCEQIEAHSRRPFDQLFPATTQSFEQRWSALSVKPSEAIQLRVEQAFSQCNKVVGEQQLLQQEKENREKAIASAANEKADVLLQLTKQLNVLYTIEDFDTELLDNINNGVKLLSQNWSRLNEIEKADKTQSLSFKQCTAAIEFQIKQLSEYGVLPDHLEKVSSAITKKLVDDKEVDSQKEESSPINTALNTTDNVAEIKTPSQLLASLRNRLKDVSLLDIDLLDEDDSSETAVKSTINKVQEFINEQDKKQEKLKADFQSRQRHISALIKKANDAINNGASNQAAGIRRTLDEKVKGLENSPTPKLPKYLAAQLEQLDAELEKLLDWKNYAVAPKKQQLIEQMETLVGSQENPEAVATKIKRLQAEWKGLSKGDNDEALWEKFHQLSQTAYEPCKKYYDDLSVIHGDNLVKREGLIKQLQDYVSTVLLSGNNAADTADQAEKNVESNELQSHKIDWVAVQTLIATAKKEWHSYAPVQYSANKPAQKAFDTVIDSIQKQLNQQYLSNCEKKQLLVTAAEKLVDSEDINAAINKVKGLQAEWKLVGLTARKDDQKLWKTFRASCDAVFEKRQQKSNEFKAELGENKQKALDIISALEELLKQESLLSIADKANELKDSFKQVGSLPKADANKINQRYNKACENYELKLTQERQSLKEQKWLAILEAANKTRLYHLADNETEKAKLYDDACSFIDGIDTWPKNSKTIIKEQLAADYSTAIKDVAQNERALRVLCIRAEIISGKETPDEDKNLRMEYQVECLKSGFGQASSAGDGTKNDELNALIFDWLVVPPVSDEPYISLVERFLESRSRAS